MGMVTEVYERNLRVALPHGIEEIVSAEDASDVLSMMLGDDPEGHRLKQLHGDPHPLTALFVPGQYIQGCYVDDDKDGRFSLKLCHLYDRMPAVAVKEGSRLVGCVRTIEDHGYSLTFGIKGLSGFLNASEVTTHLGKDVHLLPGQLIDGIVSHASTTTVQLRLDPEHSMSNSMENKSQSILPGSLVYTEIIRINTNGLETKFLNTHRGIITLFHLKEDLIKDGWHTAFIEGQVIKAIVLAWHPDRAEYLLSLKPFLIHRQLPPMPAILGHVFPDAIVQRIDPKGLSLKLPWQQHPIECYVSEDKLGDIPLLSHDFKLGQSLEVRATGFHAMEGLIVGSTKASVINSNVICFKDLHPGMISGGTVVRSFNDRVYVAVGDGIEGCARQCGYSSNTPLNKIFNPGQSVSYRVLNVKSDIRQASLSLDGRLVHASLPFPVSWEDVHEGMHVIGYVLAIKQTAVIISFGGDVHGILLKRYTKLQESESLSDVYQRHQVVKVWIRSVQLEKKKIFLTTTKTKINQRTIHDNSSKQFFKEICSPPPGLSPGDIAEATVEKVLPDGQAFLVYYKTKETKVEGTAMLSKDHLSDDPTDAFSDFQQGQCIGHVIILTVMDVVTVSMKPSLIKNAALMPRRIEDVKQNMIVHGFISKRANDFLDVTFLEQFTGRVFKNHTPMPSVSIDQQFKLGQSIDVRVIKIDMNRRRLNLAIASNKTSLSDMKHSIHASTELASPSVCLQVGDIVSATVVTLKEGGVSVRLNLKNLDGHINAMVPFSELFDYFVDGIPTIIQSGLRIRAVIIQKSSHGITLSTRPSEGGCIHAEVHWTSMACPVTLERNAAEIGMDIHGYVCGYGKTNVCLFVNIARDHVATVHAPHFGDASVGDIMQQFPLGTLIKGTLITCKYPKMGLSLRSGQVPLATVGHVNKGTVVSIQPQGIYVALRDSGIQGLIPRYDLLSHRSKIKAGQMITVRITPLTDAFHLFLEIVEDDKMDIDATDEVMDIDEDDEDMESAVDDAEFERCLTEAIQAETSLKPVTSSQAETRATAPMASSPRLKHIMWDDLSQDAPQRQEPDIDHSVSMEVKSEPELRHIVPRDPQTSDDFERLLFSQSNSSYLWIRYAASFIEGGDISKAKATLERALDAIDLREEKERLDIWLAYLNLERTQGSTTESIMSLFQRAVLCNDPKTLHCTFLKILEDSKEIEIGDAVVKSMRRRCCGSAKAVIQEMHHWLLTGRGGHCKQTLEAALKQLPKRKHVKVILQAGILEFKTGIVERGREIFEGLLSCYPKRMDIWNVYLDQELKQKDPEHARALFERVSAMSGRQKSMKTIFKRFMKFEMDHGDDRRVQHVKDKAAAYIASKASKTAS